MESLEGEFSNLNLNGKRAHQRNKNKKEKDKEKEKEEDPKEKKFKEELNELKFKLRDFQKLFDSNEVKNIFDYKFENFILIDKIVDELSVKQKLIECFNCEDIFDYLFNIWIKILEFSGCKSSSSTKDKINENKDDTEKDGDFEEKKENKNKTKGLGFIFNQIITSLDFFVPKIINNTKDNSFKEKVIETIFPNIQFIRNIEEGEFFLYYFTNVFNIKNEMKSKIEKEKQEEVNQIINSSLCFGLNFINTFDLQQMFPLEKIFKILSDNYFLISYRIYSLLVRTYIKKMIKKNI